MEIHFCKAIISKNLNKLPYLPARPEYKIIYLK